MPKRRMSMDHGEAFGPRLARLRRAAGLSLRELAREAGISHRMVSYYERETAHPPTHLLPILARVLGVSADQLLGLKPVRSGSPARDNRLQRRFRQAEKLPPAERRKLILLMDAFLEREFFRREA
ncbi:MAG: helix-turn-helix transcriptional regulator [Planctomycetes bacterium]|nr:helix-turn-helix transcriptional regulator [Planctomycetota bacterium]